MATARELFDAGKLNDAIEALGAELRNHPDDAHRRTFLFELLCFAGNWERADKQLDILAGADKDKRLGALLYRAALNAERTRHEMFEKPAGGEQPPAPPAPGGKANGNPAQSIQDADPRVGARLEIFAGENYMWIPLAHIALLEIQPPKRLRDLLWIPATIQAGPAFQGSDLGRVLLPALSPFSFRHADDAVRLGRMTVWESTPDGGEIPYGQKMLLVDDEEVPLLDVRKLEIAPPAAT
ncbi:MAG: type VI secretion system accessory protein TagJ [Bryobacteraceae bacterium]